MWRRGLLAGLACAVLAQGAPVAKATVADIPAGEVAAARYWGDLSTRCPLGVVTVVQPDLYGGAWATASRGETMCSVWYSANALANLSPSMTCMVVVHEWGHLYGHDHPGDLADPTTPMSYAYNTALVPGCLAMSVVETERQRLKDAAAAETLNAQWERRELARSRREWRSAWRDRIYIMRVGLQDLRQDARRLKPACAKLRGATTATRPFKACRQLRKIRRRIAWVIGDIHRRVTQGVPPMPRSHYN